MSEKTEKATPHKLQKAKEQGNVSKSIELTTCIFLLVCLVTTTALWPDFFNQITSLMRHLLYLSNHMSFSVDNMGHLQTYLLTNILFLWLPIALAGMLAIIAATLIQTGFVWSSKPLIPDIKRLDIIKGFKRIFSSKLVFDAAKNSLKLSLVFIVASLSLYQDLAKLSNFMHLDPNNLTSLIMTLLSKFIVKIILLLLVLAMIDKGYTRWKFAKDNRMSKQELKDEYRQREGCPKIKSKIRQLQQQLRQKTASLEQVKTASVVITNPTHLAIALSYDKAIMNAPKVVCKAQGEMVKNVKQLAARHGVPIIEHKVFARALFVSTALNECIHRDHFPIAAGIFRSILQQKAVS